MRRAGRVGSARRALIVVAACVFVGAGTLTAQAFTLYTGKPTVTSTPTSGLATANFTVRAKYVLNGPCPATALITYTFKFFWYKVISSKIPLWTKTTSACSASVYDTGASAPMHPPAPLNYPGTFVIQVAVYFSTGAPAGQTYTDTTIYTVLAPKPSPRPSPRASPTPQCGAVGQAPCASPTPSATPCVTPSAALPPSGPGGKDVATILALGLLGAIPIGGIALLMSGAVWARGRQWPRIAAMLALTVVVLTSAAACTAPNQTGQASPSDVASPSPSPSPTPTC